MSLLLLLTFPMMAPAIALPAPPAAQGSEPGADTHSDCADLLGVNTVCATVRISGQKLRCEFFGPPSNVWHCLWRFSYSGEANSPAALPGVFELTGTADGLTGSNALCNWIPPSAGCSGSGSLDGQSIIPQGQSKTITGTTVGLACAPTVFFSPINGVSTCVEVSASTPITLP